jgi:hypothetical protein
VRGIVETDMSTTFDFHRKQVSGALSVALIVCSILWHAAACEYYATSGFRVDFSATPLIWMVIMMITPAVCFAGCMLLVEKRKLQPFAFIEWWALASAFLPVTLGSLLSVWAVKVLFSMSGF